MSLLKYIPITFLSAAIAITGCNRLQPWADVGKKKLILGEKIRVKEQGRESLTRVEPFVTLKIVRQQGEKPVSEFLVLGNKIREDTKIIERSRVVLEREDVIQQRDEVWWARSYPRRGWPQKRTVEGPVTERETFESSGEIKLPSALVTTIPLNGVELTLSSDEDLFFNGKNPAYVTTDAQGRARVILSSQHHSMSLDELIRREPRFAEILPPALGVREKVVRNGIVDIDLPYSVSVREGTYDGMPLSGAEESGSVRVKAISEAVLSRAIGDYVQANVNPVFKRVTFKTRDIDSHSPLRKTTYHLRTTASPPEEILRTHFAGSLLEIAKAHLGYYERGERTAESINGELTLTYFPGSNIELEVTNPRYNFFKGEITIGGETGTQIIEMSELGQKVRVRMVEE